MAEARNRVLRHFENKTGYVENAYAQSQGSTERLKRFPELTLEELLALIESAQQHEEATVG